MRLNREPEDVFRDLIAEEPGLSETFGFIIFFNFSEFCFDEADTLYHQIIALFNFRQAPAHKHPGHRCQGKMPVAATPNPVNEAAAILVIWSSLVEFVGIVILG